jgi:hypothetical protein
MLNLIEDMVRFPDATIKYTLLLNQVRALTHHLLKTLSMMVAIMMPAEYRTRSTIRNPLPNINAPMVVERI